MNREEEEKILNEKLSIIRRQIASLEKEYEKLYDYTISRREDLREERSSLKFDEVSSELIKINKKISKCNAINTRIRKLKISEKSPYFACVNFDDENYYLGKLGVRDENGFVVVNDWRAPVASLYYDFETGPAYFMAPGNRKIEGEIKSKKQYKIEKSKLIYFFETKVDVVDEILQLALTENSSEHMKTIVASIQKEQNKLIRQPKDRDLLVQGVAGSGKTSIALHRIAYLLYNNKEFKNKKTYILSPNKVFSNYISTVLPELGEKKAEDISLDEILNETFGDLINYNNKFEDIEKCLKSEKFYSLHLTKTSFNFYQNLKKFLDDYFLGSLNFKEIKIKDTVFEKNKLEKYYSEITGNTLFEKLNNLTNNILLDFITVKTPLSFEAENSVKHFAILKLLGLVDKKKKNIISIYRKFLRSQNIGFSYSKKFSFDDAVNLLYIKNYIFGPDKKVDAIHLVIDELQDYSPIALDIIRQTFDCTITALGDLYQKIDGKVDNSIPEQAKNVLKIGNEVYQLSTVYRSTKQIAEFSSKILQIKNIKFVNRDGEKVEINSCKNGFECIKNQIEKLKEKYKNIAVITKTFKEANEIAEKTKIKLISPASHKFKTGAIVTPAYLAKGLEFDAVIIADAGAQNFKTELDAQQLFVGTTRALHKLIINYTNELTPFIKK